MTQHLLTDSSLTVLGAGPLGGTLMLGALIGFAVLFVWFPPPLIGLLRGLITRLSPGRGGSAASRL